MSMDDTQNAQGQPMMLWDNFRIFEYWNSTGINLAAWQAVRDGMRQVRDDYEAALAQAQQQLADAQAQLDMEMADELGVAMSHIAHLEQENNMLFTRAAQRLATIKELEAELAQLRGGNPQGEEGQEWEVMPVEVAETIAGALEGELNRLREECTWWPPDTSEQVRIRRQLDEAEAALAWLNKARGVGDANSEPE